MADSYFPNGNEMFGDDDNADDNSLVNFSSTNEHLDFLDLDACDENVSFWTQSIPPTQDAQDEPPAVPEQAADEPPPSNSANDTRAPPQPSKLDWENQKANIIALYRDHKAKELPRIMQDRHGFYASVKQYRSHLKEWSFAKNVKDLDMRTIVRIMQWRKENEGKETQFRVQNRPVSRVNIVRFIKRKGLTTNTNTPHLGPTPEYITYNTPPRSESGNTSGRQSRPHGSSSASQDQIATPIGPMAANSLDHQTHNTTANDTAARTRLSTTHDTSRVQLKLSPVDLTDLLILCTAVPETDMWLSIGMMGQMPEADRAGGINVGSYCSYCGFLSDSPVVWDQSLVTSIQPDLSMTSPWLIAFLGLAIKHNEDVVLRHLVQRCQQEKFAKRIHRHLLCIALDHGRVDLFRQLLLHGLDVAVDGSASEGLLRQACTTLHDFIIARIKRDDNVDSIAEAMGFMYRACIMGEKLWKDEVLWTALQCRRAGVLRVCLEPPTSAVLDIDELMIKAPKIREITQKTGSTQAAAELVVAAASVVPENGATVLHLATSLLLGNEVRRLLDTGTNVNDAMKTGETALHILAGLSSPNGDEVAQILLGRGANPAAADSVGDSALHHTARNPWKYWRERFAYLLVQAGADINTLNDRDETPCITATLSQDLTAARGAMQWFLDNGASEDARDCDGNTARRYLEQRERDSEPGILDILGGIWAFEEPWTAEDQEMDMRAELLHHQLELYEM